MALWGLVGGAGGVGAAPTAAFPTLPLVPAEDSAAAGAKPDTKSDAVALARTPALVCGVEVGAML